MPICKEDLKKRNWDQVDFVYVIGDAYVDHSSFGAAIISRVLESHGYRVAILSQPDWKRDDSITEFGEPRLGFLVSSGNMDSMVNHYTSAKRPRSTDAYSPGGVRGRRPDRAVTVYGNLIRRTYKKTPVILGGIEASLRRLAHYDYWSDQVKRSVLLDSGADILSYGMGERSIVEIADALAAGIPVSEITYVAGTVYKSSTLPDDPDLIQLPGFEEVSTDQEAYRRSFLLQYRNMDAVNGKVLAENYGTRGYLIQNPPSLPLTEQEMDAVYELPYMRQVHPELLKQGEIPAFSEIRFSLTANRGCFGACHFCALAFHQGRVVQSRSVESLVKEGDSFREEPGYKGYIHDVGGPTADFMEPACEKQKSKGVCSHRQCLFPEPCPNLKVDHGKYRRVLKALRELPHVKKVFIRSGLRFDYSCYEKDPGFLREIAEHHVSGQLRVAPEHVVPRVLEAMGKPSHEIYESFCRKFAAATKRVKKEQYIVPYFISSHPGCTIRDAIRLAEYIRDLRFTPEQVQDFYPTPSTISTCMYYTGKDLLTGKAMHIPKGVGEKAMQRALLQYKLPQNYELVRKALLENDRKDLIGFGPHCLIPPEAPNRKSGRKRKAPNGKDADRKTKNGKMPIGSKASDSRNLDSKEQSRKNLSGKRKKRKSFPKNHSAH